VIGAIGLPLLRWLDERTFPFEARFLDPPSPSARRAPS
jgi:hypothetical protein